MKEKKEKITILDIIKGLLFIFSLYIIYILSPVLISIWSIVFHWILDTSLFFLRKTNRENTLNIILGLFYIFIFPKVFGYSKGVCNAYKLSTGYKPLYELNNIFKKRQPNKSNANNSALYYISMTLMIVFISLFLIGLFVKAKALDLESIKEIVSNIRRHVEVLFNSITAED